MLKPITKDDKSPAFAVIDIETDKDGNATHLGYYSQYEYRLYRNVPDFVAFVLSQKIDNIYAHAGMRFDYALMLKEIIRQSENITISYSGNAGIFAVVKTGKRKITLADSFRLLPASLRELTNKFVPDKPKLLLDKMPWELSDSEICEYLKRDCESLYLLISRFWKNIDDEYGCTRALTVSSLSMKIFRKHFLKYNILGSNKKLYNHERDSYFGGMVICHPGEYNNVVALDVNSMYPYAMFSYSYPKSYVGHWTDVIEKNRTGLYLGYFYHPDTIPSFIYDIETRKLSNYGKCILDLNTIEYLKKFGTFDVKYGYVYYHCDYIFKDFVEYFYSLKLQSKEPYRTIYKIILNSLYGKFAQKREMQQISTQKPKGVFKAFPLKVGDGDYREIFDFTKFDLSPSSFPAIASLVTLHSRRYLHWLIMKAPERFIYCDTDSVHFKGEKPPQGIPLGDNLGELKIEYQGFGRYIGKKIYEHPGTKIKCKGIPNPGLSFEGFTTPRIFEFDTFTSMRMQIKNDSQFQRETRHRTIDFSVLQEPEK